MNVLILSGVINPNREDNPSQTQAAINYVNDLVQEESFLGSCDVRVVNVSSMNIGSCQNCGKCWQGGLPCSKNLLVNQLFQQIYTWADVVIIASPVYYGMATAPILELLSYCQPRYSPNAPSDKPVLMRYWLDQSGEAKIPLGVSLICGGGSTGAPDDAVKFARRYLKELGCAEPRKCIIGDTDKTAFKDDREAQTALYELMMDIYKEIHALD